MKARVVLSALFAILLGIAVGGAGCANGEGDNASVSDDASDDGGGEGGPCVAPKTTCGSACVNTSNDTKNCGKCGAACAKDQVCNNGKCDYSCTPPQTLCGTAQDAGADASHDSGAGDATVEGGAGDAGAKDSGAGDAGTTTPYCANLDDDPDNCGKCGHKCGKDHVCKSGKCVFNCPPNETGCITSDTCIPSGTCCSSADCKVTGEICPQPGSNCGCPSGERVCTKNNSCISNADCCTNADCTVQGSTCPTPGGACQCPGGQKACNASNTCIPQTDCCTGADCGPEPNVATYTCTGGKCGIGTCTTGPPACYDVNGQYSDGCECCDDGYGQTCGAATTEGPVGIGQTLPAITGQIPTTNEDNWFAVTFNGDNTQKAYHPSITISGGQAGEFVFDIYSACGGATLTCGDGGNCNGKTAWEVMYGAQATGNPGDPNWQPLPAVGTVYVRVYRGSGAVTCDQYTLTISD